MTTHATQCSQCYRATPCVLLQGIGRATALVFARKGFNVVVAARDPTKLQYVADDCCQAAARQQAAIAVPTDVTNEVGAA